MIWDFHLSLFKPTDIFKNNQQNSKVSSSTPRNAFIDNEIAILLIFNYVIESGFQPSAKMGFDRMDPCVQMSKFVFRAQKLICCYQCLVLLLLKCDTSSFGA